MSRTAVSAKLWREGLMAFVVATALSAAPARAAAQERANLGVKVVVNTEGGAARLTREDLARIYLGKKTLWEGGTRIAPAMLDEETPAMQPLMERVLQKSVEQYRAYWKRLLFSGGGTAPRTFRNSAQVLDFVAKNPGALGVVEASASDDRVKVVEITN